MHPFDSSPPCGPAKRLQARGPAARAADDVAGALPHKTLYRPQPGLTARPLPVWQTGAEEPQRVEPAGRAHPLLLDVPQLDL